MYYTTFGRTIKQKHIEKMSNNTDINAENNRIATLGSEESLNTKPLNTNQPITQLGGAKNKTLSKYKKKYNVLNY